jgi:hypothetical protein
LELFWRCSTLLIYRLQLFWWCSTLLSNTYCVVFLFCFSSSCVPYVAGFSGLSIFDCPLAVL